MARVSPRKIWFASIPGSETPPLKNGGDFFSLNDDPLSYTNGKTRKDNMSELVIKTAKENGDLPKKLSIKKCSCCYHPPTKEYPKKFVKDNPDLFSDEEINSNKILEIDYKDIRSDPMQLINILNKRNKYHNTKKE